MVWVCQHRELVSEVWLGLGYFAMAYERLGTVSRDQSSLSLNEAHSVQLPGSDTEDLYTRWLTGDT